MGGTSSPRRARGLSGKRKGKSQMEETTYYAARKMRSDRVYASGRNDGESVAAVNACGGTLGTTAEGYASAGPRRQLHTGPGPVRAATGPRPTQARGDVTYFDTTGPHRGPGKALGDPAGRRVVLYCSWAKGAWEREGSPAYAFRLHGMIMGLEAFSADHVNEGYSSTGHITAVSLRVWKLFACVCVCILPFFITRATGTLVNTPTDPRRRRGGVIR